MDAASPSPFHDPLFGPLTGDAAMAVLFTPHATIQAMLDVEAALAEVQAALGVIPADAATPIAEACHAERYDIAAIGRAGTQSGNIAIPLVKALTARVDGETARYVHWGATSQDIVDTGLVLQLRGALDRIELQLSELADALAMLARRYRDTPMAGRTWLQHALPITFGLKAAGWLDAITRHRQRMVEMRPRVLTLQFGGASGTLASLGTQGPAVAAALAQRLGLGLPATPWHTNRDRIAEAATFAGLVCGTLGKLARDVSLMMQTDVGEAFEPAAAGRGGSSTMPHKRNPVLCAAILASATTAPGRVATMLAAQVQEHERAAGTWSAEWRVLPDLLIDTSGALARATELATGIEVDATRMRANIETTNGLILAEAAMMALAPYLGRAEAHHLVEQASRQAIAEARHLEDVLSANESVMRHLDAASLAKLFEPSGYLGASARFIEQVLDAHATMRRRNEA